MRLNRDQVMNIGKLRDSENFICKREKLIESEEFVEDNAEVTSRVGGFQ